MVPFFFIRFFSFATQFPRPPLSLWPRLAWNKMITFSTSTAGTEALLSSPWNLNNKTKKLKLKWKKKKKYKQFFFFFKYQDKWSQLPPLPNCPPPLISPKAKKILAFFHQKGLFFSIGKKEGGLTAPPYFFKILVGRGGGQLTPFILMVSCFIWENGHLFCFLCKQKTFLFFIFGLLGNWVRRQKKAFSFFSEKKWQKLEKIWKFLFVQKQNERKCVGHTPPCGRLADRNRNVKPQLDNRNTENGIKIF